MQYLNVKILHKPRANIIDPKAQLEMFEGAAFHHFQSESQTKFTSFAYREYRKSPLQRLLDGNRTGNESGVN